MVLDIDGDSIEINGESLSEGYTASSKSTIRSIGATSHVTVDLEDPLTNLKLEDFNVEASIDGQSIGLEEL